MFNEMMAHQFYTSSIVKRRETRNKLCQLEKRTYPYVFLAVCIVYMYMYTYVYICIHVL